VSFTHSLESQYYTDPVYFAKERERIFKAAWWLLGPSHLVEKENHYLCDTICNWSVFVVRDQQGVLRGFHNVCRHRGARLLDSGSGESRLIKCPYHAWGFNLAGELVATPGFAARDSLDKSAYHLYAVAVVEWRGMVFVNIAPQPEPFSDWIGSLDKLMDDFPSCDQLQYYDKFVVEGQANWKTYCDNTVEGYHLHAVHPRLAQAVAHGSVEIKPYDKGKLVAFHVEYDGRGDDAALRSKAGLWAFKYPGFQVAVSANALKIERVEATGLSSLRSTNWAWYKGLDKSDTQESFAWSESVVREDIGICENVQRNLDAGIYCNGPLSPLQEQNVAVFQDIVRTTLDA